MIRIRRRSPNPPVKTDGCEYQVPIPDAEPANILEEIVWHKETEVAKLRLYMPLQELQKQVAIAPPSSGLCRRIAWGKNEPRLNC